MQGINELIAVAEVKDFCILLRLTTHGVTAATVATLFMKFSNTLGPTQKGLIIVLLVNLALRCDKFSQSYPKKIQT